MHQQELNKTTFGLFRFSLRRPLLLLRLEHLTDFSKPLPFQTKMVNAWYMNSNDETEDQRSERHLSPPQFLSLEELKAKTGVLYWQVGDTF